MAQKPITPVKLNIGTSKDVRQAPTFWKNYFPLIRIASITLGTCLLFSLVFIFASRYYFHQQETNKQLAQTELAHAQEKYTEATTKKNNIRDYGSRYLELVENGFIGEEKRLEVIELIRKIQESHKLLPITYTIAPQQVVTIDPSLFTSELDLFASKLTVNMGVLHELDVLTLINQLRENSTYIPQSCTFKINDTVTDSLISPRLDVQCKLFLLTMNRRIISDESAVAPIE
jgi:hypothetical protein